MIDPLHYEDFFAGQRFETRTAVMDRERIIEFGREFDPQPQHLGDEEAAGSMFGTLVASGWHTSALTMRLQYEMVMARIPGGAMGAQVDSMAWKRPVLPGDVLRVVVEILDKRPSRSRPAHGLVSLRTTTLNQRDEAVLDMKSAVLVPRRPAADEGGVAEV